MLAWLGASQFSGLVLCLYGLKSKSRDRFPSRNLTDFSPFIRLTLLLSSTCSSFRDFSLYFGCFYRKAT